MSYDILMGITIYGNTFIIINITLSILDTIIGQL